jgi:8-oxo-dGTP pyrophosphatase MutT (NUDIX family)
MSTTPPLVGLNRTELDRVESTDFALSPKRLRPRDSATLILLDRSSGEPRVLMGRRSSKHAFMPGKFVFPGGRTDPADSKVDVASGLDESEVSRIAGHLARATPTRAKAIALSAVREMYEEAGILIGREGVYPAAPLGWEAFVENGVVPSLDGLRIVARAITPPGRVRRFDTRFFASWTSNIAVTLPDGGPTQELEELCWLPITEARKLDLPTITVLVLGDLEKRLEEDPELSAGKPIPFYRMVNRRMVRTVD